MATNKLPSTWFAEDFASARQKFLDSVADCRAAGIVAELETRTIASKSDGDLPVDLAWFPSGSGSERLVIHTSGVHGIEGLAGNAVLRVFMKEILADSLNSGCSHLIIHGLNPHGLKHGRRYTENNVDLNRNFGSDDSLYATINDGYAALLSLLMPAGKASPSLAGRLQFYLKALVLAVAKGQKTLRDAILKGQYQFPAGPYYGGSSPEAQKKLVDEVLARRVPGHQAVLLLDYHTAYGNRGQLHLFATTPSNDAMRQQIGQVFEGRAIDWPEGDFYTISGDYTAYLADQLLKQYRIPKVVPMTFEYGTLNNLSLAGSLDSLYRVVVDCQGHGNGFVSSQAQAACRRLTQDMYYPADPAWQQAVLAETRLVLSKALERFSRL